MFRSWLGVSSQPTSWPRGPLLPGWLEGGGGAGWRAVRQEPCGVDRVNMDKQLTNNSSCHLTAMSDFTSTITIQ